MSAADFLKCPKGHSLPHRIEGGGSCTPVVCGAVVAKRKAGAALRAERSVEKRVQEEVSKVVAEGGVALARVADEMDEKHELQSKQYEKWAKFIKLPREDISPEEAEKHADAKLASLLPVAVGILEDQAKFGTREEKRAAARQILESNGRGKREAAANAQAPIIIQVQGGVSLPWRQEKAVQGTAEVVDGVKPPSK